MKHLTFLSFFLFILMQGYAQNEYNGFSYYARIASDSVISQGKIDCAYLGDTAEQHLSAGLYRIIINPNIDIQNDLDIRIMDEQRQELTITKYDEYIEFFNSTSQMVNFIVETIKPLEEDMKVVGRIFWIYTKNAYKEPLSFELTDIEGKVYTNENLLGKVVVLNFWRTRCGPCVKEIPELNKVARQYAERDDMMFISMSMDWIQKSN